ncbi:hypothetical protein FJR38_26445 [Anabaena sp. UHCC 0253]|uniref:TolB family protein n=1 Tax=Anabaena sp. UHCC 0253 TaxID=2590019 RepID=UPI00144653A2|nr:PD40 domain-containing protein [Anabaena sp. UHCC 0253]MTJ55946.1 hypothetical protein [Anabaena sp. UHCC 0253]
MNSTQKHLTSAFTKQFSFSELLVEEEWYGFTFSTQNNAWVACHKVGEQTNLYLVSLQGGLPQPLLPGNFFGQTGATYHLSAPVLSPDGQKIAFAVQSSHEIDSGLWLVDYPNGLPTQIYQGSIKFSFGDFNEFTQTIINNNSPEIIFSEDGNWILFRSSYQSATSTINECLGEPQKYSVLLQVAINKSQIKTRCFVKNGRVQSFTPLDSSAKTLAIGVNWGQCSEVYVVETDSLQIETPSDSPLDINGIYAPIQVVWDKYDSQLPLVIRCNNTGFAKWHRFSDQIGNLSYNGAETIIPGDFDDGQLLIQPDSWLLATNEIGLGRQTIWQVERNGQKQAITETADAVHTPINCIDSEVIFYEEKAFQPPKLLKQTLGAGIIELGSCSHQRGTAQVLLTDFSTEDGVTSLCPNLFT